MNPQVVMKRDEQMNRLQIIQETCLEHLRGKGTWHVKGGILSRWEL